MSAANLRFALSRIAAELSRGLLVPRRHALPPFVGYLEECDREISGWLLRPREPVTMITASLDDGGEVELRADLPRPDVRDAFGEEAIGFRGRCKGEGTILKVWVNGASRRLAFAVALRAPQPMEAWRDRRFRASFERLLVTAADRDFPRVAAAAPQLFDELRRGWRGAEGSWAELRRHFLDRRQRATHKPAADLRRILVISGIFPSVLHGGGLRLFDLLCELSQRYEVDLCAGFRDPLDAASLVRLQPHLHAVHVAPRLSADGVERWLVAQGRSPGDYDVVCFEFPESIPLIERTRRWAKKSFFTMMECRTRARMFELEDALGTTDKPGVSLRELVADFVAERSALELCDGAVAVTDDDADFAARVYGARRPLVVPTCVSSDLSRQLGAVADADHLPPVALFVGYFEHRPNLDATRWYLENVHSRVLSRLPDYRLRIVGWGSGAELHALTANTANVDLIGAVDDLAPALAQARIGLAPIVSGAGIRGKLNQYAAAARPAVSTRLGASGLPYRHDESILLADTPEAFAAAVTRLLSEDDLWRRLSLTCRAVAAEHAAWPQAVARLERWYLS
jgi:glycosyltransferase involved in cell wall biosynthesis